MDAGSISLMAKTSVTTTWTVCGARSGLSCRIRSCLAEQSGDNIRFGVPDASQEMVEAAAKATHIHDYIESLPDKYDTLY